MTAAKINAHLDASIQAVASWHESVSKLGDHDKRVAVFDLLSGSDEQDKTLLLRGFAAHVIIDARVIECVCRNRRNRRDLHSGVDVQDGVFVFYEPELTFQCGLAKEASGGLFDMTDSPSWIYWLGIAVVERKWSVDASPKLRATRGLLAWFPRPYASQVRAGVAGQLGEALEVVNRKQVISLAFLSVHDAPQA